MKLRPQMGVVSDTGPDREMLARIADARAKGRAIAVSTVNVPGVGWRVTWGIEPDWFLFSADAARALAKTHETPESVEAGLGPTGHLLRMAAAVCDAKGAGR